MNRRGPLPLTFEDRTAGLTTTDLDDIYDRMFFHVRRAPPTKTKTTTTTPKTTEIFEMHFPASRHRGNVPKDKAPIVSLKFLPGEQLGTVAFAAAAGPAAGAKGAQSEVPMSQYLRKTAFFGSSLSRKFVASDGNEYKWEYRTNPGQEWTCTTTKENYIVAHYDLRPSHVRYFDNASGNSLVVHEAFAHIASELVASSLIMRHIALYNL